MGNVASWLEEPVNNVIDSLPERYRPVITDILAERAPELLASLRSRDKPTIQEQQAVTEILADAFTEHFGPGHIPTEQGVLIDDALGQFLTRWPADDLESE